MVVLEDEDVSPSPIRAVIFDLDGTLTRPFLDFAAIRAAIGDWKKKQETAKPVAAEAK